MSFADKKGIVVASGFKLQAEVLLDARQQVDTIQERDELVTIHAATPGLRVYVKADKTSYVYNGTGWDKITTGNAYVHPTGDGNHHVPATGTTNNGKVLMAGATAGSESWKTLTTDDISDFPDSLPTPNNLVVKFNGGTSEGTNQFTFNGSAGKTVNITPAAIGAAAASHGTHVTYGTEAPKANGTASPGTAASVSRSDHVHPLQTTISGNAGSATKLATARTIDGVSFNGTANINHFATCETAAATAAKTVTLTGFTLAAGAIVTVKFTATNTAANPTLNVNSTGAKAIMYRGSAITAGYLAANRVYTFVYDGTDYELIGDINTDTNTTYGIGNATTAGITKLYTGTGSNTDGTMTQSAITSALNGKAASSHTHTTANITDFDEAVEGLLPVKLPNPYALTFAGAVTGTYDGSSAKTITIPSVASSTTGSLIVKLNSGTTEGTNMFTFDGSGDKTINITPASIGAAAASHGTHVTYGTEAPKANGTASAGTATTVSRSDHVHPLQTTISGNAGSATKLATARTIDGVSFNGTANITHFATCDTAAATAAKTVTCTGFTLAAGSVITIKFSATNTAASPTLNVNSTGAKAIMYRGSAISAGYLAANRVYTFVYDGTDYELIGDINTDTNTTYSTGTATKAGITKLYTGTGSNTDGTMTQSAITTALNGKAASSHTHTSANITDFEEAVEELLPTIPTKLPNPYTLTFTGAVSTTYDGSAARTVNIPTSGSTDADLVIKLNSGTTEGTNQFTFDGSTAKTVNITASSIGAAASSHTHSTATTSAAGFLRALNGSTANFLRGDGTWATPPNTTYSAMKGATSSAAGSTGLVPAPAAGKQTSFLRGDGTWVVPTNTNTTYTLTKDGSTITLTGSDGSKTSVTDSNTTYSLASFGITATAAELNKLDGVTATAAEINYLDGVTSNIQTQLNGKAASSHTHNYAGSSSAGGAATSANKVNTDLIIKLNGGTTEGTNQFTFNGSAAKTINITPAAIGAAASSHGTHVTFSSTAPLAAGTASAGSATTVARSDHRHPLQTTVSGNAGTATKLATARTISLTGDATGSATFDGSANASIAATVAHHTTTAIASNQDLNNYTDPGWYYCTANDTVATLSNSPTTNAFTLIVTQHVGTNQLLIEYMTATPRIFTRNKYQTAWGSWYEIYHTGQKPTASEIGAAASSHNHSAANITSGTLAVARGGTGITANPSMLVNLASTSAASVFATSPRPGVTGALGIANGGTGATTAAAARTALGAAASSHTHTGAQVTGLTASRALISNSSGAVTVSAVTSTELGYLDGVTSSIQTQLNGKAASSHTHKYAGSSSAGGAATVANKINLPVGTTLFATSSSATFFSATLGGTWTVVGNIDTIVVRSGSALTLYLHRKTAS